jgi:hypothetical protein
MPTPVDPAQPKPTQQPAHHQHGVAQQPAHRRLILHRLHHPGGLRKRVQRARDLLGQGLRKVMAVGVVGAVGMVWCQAGTGADRSLLLLV